MDSIKFHRKVGPTCFIGLRGTENQIKQCTCKLQAKPYDFTQASPKTLKNDQQVVCCSSIGWARGEIKNRLRNQRFQVQLMDYLDDENGTPIIEDLSWESIRILPRHLSIEKIPKLSGIFYLVDPDEKLECEHTVDVRRMSLLLERMSESDDLFCCRIVKPLDPLHAVIELYFDLPLNGLLNGKFEVPYVYAERKRGIVRDSWLVNEFHLLKEEIINAENSDVRRSLLEKVESLFIGDNSPGLDDLDICSDDDDLSSENLFKVPMRPSDFVLESSTMDRLKNFSSQEDCIYLKDKSAPPENNSPSRKQKQSNKKKNRKIRNLTNFSGESSGTGSESLAGDPIPSSRSDCSNNAIPIEFLRTEYFHCGDCGYSVSSGHKCDRKGKRLEEMWGRQQ